VRSWPRPWGKRDQNAPTSIEGGDLSGEEHQQLRPYLLGEKVILRKELGGIRCPSQGNAPQFNGVVPNPPRLESMVCVPACSRLQKKILDR
jgi:hypothetical protein